MSRDALPRREPLVAPAPRESAFCVLWVGGTRLVDLALAEALEDLSRPLERVPDLHGARQRLARGDVAFLILDLDGIEGAGPAFLSECRAEFGETPAVAVSSQPRVSEAIAWVRAGAADYLARPLEDVCALRSMLGKLLAGRSEGVSSPRDGESLLVGQSEALRGVLRRAQSLHRNESNVLVQGESGTGKELLARAVHDHSPRADGPFVPVDCGALPETIIESELFGHRKGAFTGATGSPGLFRMAEGGTIFLDEIGEIPPAVQAKLLRALQHKEVRPVGASRTLPVDIRVIAATHRDLVGMVDAGSFRMDLFYRLNVVRLSIPPLRERRDDIEPLARHFLEKHGGGKRGVDGISPGALRALREHAWPGNVRELENVIESSLPLVSDRWLELSDLTLGHAPRSPGLPEGLAADPSAGTPEGLALSLDAYEKAALQRALEESAGDASVAAERLGIGRSTLYRKLTKHGLRPSRSSA